MSDFEHFSNDRRSFWSVMIPTYNPRADYLEQTLRSVLVQDAGHEQMQIEVVDNCSKDVDVEWTARPFLYQFE